MNTIPNMTGYKATNKDMRCRDTQFALGVWSDPVAGDLELCKNGYHFCKHPSGVHSYYSLDDTRVFEIEAEDVLEAPATPGVDYKLVARRVKLVKEITPTGKTEDLNTGSGNTGDGNAGGKNTGYRNTGRDNTGDNNTGYRNTGDSNAGCNNAGNNNTGTCNTGVRNAGISNTGDCNTGYNNTGNCNTGSHNTGGRNTGGGNTGDRNTGERNTGHDNTGHCNTGDDNTGNRNTGNGNTGEGNATNYCSGFFCAEEPKLLSFNTPCDLTRSEFIARYGETVRHLSNALLRDAEIDYSEYARLPGITPEKLKVLHNKHKAIRCSKTINE